MFMKECTKCQSENYVKAGFKKAVAGTIQKYKKLNEEQIKLIERIYEEIKFEYMIMDELYAYIGIVFFQSKFTKS